MVSIIGANYLEEEQMFDFKTPYKNVNDVCYIFSFLIQYRKRRTMVLQELDRLKLPYVRPEGAFYVFPDISKYRLSSLDFCTRMINEAKLAATPGFCFGDDACIRLSYCCSEDIIQEGMKRLEQFLAILKKEGRG